MLHYKYKFEDSCVEGRGANESEMKTLVRRLAIMEEVVDEGEEDFFKFTSNKK